MLVSSRVNVGFDLLDPDADRAGGRAGREAEEEDDRSSRRCATQDGRHRSAACAEQRRTSVETTETEPPGYTHTKRQILLIEDNPDMVDQYRRALQREGFDIFTASIPLEAEAMASGLHPTHHHHGREFRQRAGLGHPGQAESARRYLRHPGDHRHAEQRARARLRHGRVPLHPAPVHAGRTGGGGAGSREAKAASTAS